MRKRLLLIAMAVLTLSMSGFAQQTLTVCNGTATEGHVPLYGYYADAFTKSQFIYTTSDLATLPSGAVISGMKFYSSSTSVSWGSATWKVYLNTTSLSSLGSSYETSIGTEVYNGSLQIASNGEMVVTFANNYVYGSGNLLVTFEQQIDGSWVSASFYGVAQGVSLAGYDYDDVSYADATQYTFTPKAEISYFGGDPNFCYQPMNLAVSNITTDSAFVSFQAGANETAWTLKWGARGFDVETQGTTVNLTDTTLQLAGLTSGTFYDVYVRSECTATSNYSMWSKLTFKTATVPATLPYYTDFGPTADNGQWNMSGSGSPFVIADDTLGLASYSAGGALFVSGDNGNTIATSGVVSTYALRDITIATAGNYVISYRWKGNGSYAYGRAFLMPASHSLFGSIGSTQVPQEWIDLGNGALTGATTWQLANVEFNVAVAGEYRLAFYWCNSYSYNDFEGLAIDDMSLTALTCPAPVNLRMESSDTVSAVLAWHENGTATAWTVEYGPKGFMEGNGTTLSANDTVITISGLQPSTMYDAYVRANCSATDMSNASLLTFITACPQYQSVPYFENFDAYVGFDDYYSVPYNNLPTCWDQINTSASSSYANLPVIVSYGGYSGNNCMYSYIYGSGDQYAILPAFNNISTLQVSFMAKKGSSYNSADFQVGVMDSQDASTFTPIATIQPASTSYQYYVVCLDTYTGSYNNIAFRFQAPGGYSSKSSAIDDITVEPIPSCKKPVNFTVAGVTMSSATLSWTDDNLTPAAGGYEIEWGPANFAQGTGTTVLTDSTWYEITNLVAGTHYDAYVKSVCGATDASDWVGPLTFAPGEALIGDGSIENYYGWNNCYKNSWAQSIYKSTEIPLTGLITHIAFRVTSTGGGATFNTANIYMGETTQNANTAWIPFADQTLVCSATNVAINQTGWITFELQTPFFYSGNDNLVISYSKTMSDYNCSLTWQSSGVTNGTLYRENDNNASYAQYPTESGSTQDYRMDIKLTLGDASYYCARPSMPVLSQNGSMTATVAWNAGNTETAWELKYDTVGFDVDIEGTLVTPLTQTSYVMTNLTDSASYDVYVRAICNDSTLSDWRGPLSFTTLPMCAAPTQFHVVSSTATSFNLAWTPGYEETQWTVEYDTAGFVQGTGTSATVNTPTIEIGNLTNGLSYDFYIRSDCDSTTFSVWAGPYTYTLGEVTIGEGNTEHNYLPMYGYYGYSYSQQIYLASEMTGQNMITAVKVYVSQANVSSNIGSIKLFLGHTSKSSFSNSNDFVNPADLEVVYSDNVQWQMQQGWNTFVLDEPFLYDGVSNLVFGFYEGAAGYASSYPKFYVHQTGENMSILQYSDTQSSVSYTDPYNAGGSTSFQKVRNNIKFMVAPVDPNFCFAPANISIDVLNTDTAVASWVTDAPSVLLTWGTYGFDPDSAGTQVTVTVDTFAFTGLTPNTYYEMYLRANCTDSTYSVVKGPYGFRTPCGTSTGIPFAEDFETWAGVSSTWSSSGVIPSCWNSINTGTDDYYSYPYIISGYGQNGGNAMFFYTYYDNGYYEEDYGEQYVILPPFDNVSNLQVEFWGKGYQTIGTLVVGIMDTFNVASFVAIDTFNFSTDQFNYEISYLSSYAGTGRYIAFKTPYATTGSTNSVFVDDITVSTIPACPPVTKVQVISVDTTSATIKWTENGSATAWEVEYGPIGFAHGAGTVVSAPTNPFTITGLTHSTGYQCYVRPTCGASWSVQPKTFYTAQMPASLPYSCGFEASEAESTMWTLENGDETNQWFIGADMYGYSSYAGQNGLYISYEVVGAPVGMVNYYDNSAPSKVYAYRTFNLEAGDYVVTFKWKVNGEDECDYIRAFLAPTSSVLSAGSSNGITATATPDGWIALGGELSGVEDWATYYNEEVHIIDGGMYNLVFYWVNDANSGSYPAPAIDNVQLFAMTCPLPSNLNCTAADVSTATLTWTEMGTATEWNIEYGPAGFAQGTGTVVPANTNPFTLTNLNASTMYHAYVQAVCGPDDVSGWRGPVEFMTQSCNAYEMCPFTLIIKDVVADGWMGCAVKVYNGVNYIDSYTLYSGQGTKTFAVPACPGDVTLEWVMGAFPNECQIIVLSNAGDTVYTCLDASVFTDGQQFLTFTHTCEDICETPQNLTVTKSSTGATLTWSAVEGIESYSIYRNNTKIANNVTATTYADAVTTNGHYCYKVSSNCEGGNESVPSEEHCVDTDVDVLENAAETARVFPNPTNNKVKVEANGMTRVEVMNILGQRVYVTDLDADEFEFDFGAYEAGVYMLRIETTTGSATKRVTVVK